MRLSLLWIDHEIPWHPANRAKNERFLYKPL